MKVRYVRQIDEIGNRVSDSSLKIGEIYHVIEVYIDSSDGRRYRITNYNEVEHPGKYIYFILESECFEIVTTLVPSSWKIFINEDAKITLRPFAWEKRGFWEDFNEKKAWAEEVFGENINQIFSNEKLSDKMKVKYIGSHDEGDKAEGYRYLNIGNIYEVGEIRISPTGEISYVCRSASAFCANPKCFEIVSTNDPYSWKMLVRKNKEIILVPASVIEKESFWEHFFNGKLWADEIFREERALIFREDPY